MSKTSIDLSRLSGIRLSAGSHESPQLGMCVMEAVAWLMGEKWSDAPTCVPSDLATCCRRANDCMSDEGRQALKPLIPRIVNAPSLDDDPARPFRIADWVVRRVAGVRCDPIVDAESARAAASAATNSAATDSATYAATTYAAFAVLTPACAAAAGIANDAADEAVLATAYVTRHFNDDKRDALLLEGLRVMLGDPWESEKDE